MRPRPNSTSNENNLISKVYFDTFFEVAGIALCIFESNHIITRVNGEFERLSGYTRKEIESKMKWTDFVLPEYIEKMKQYHVNRRKGLEAPNEYEFEIKNSRGEIKKVKLNIKLIPETHQSIASLLNLTEIQQGQENYEALFDTSVTGIFVHDLDGTIININNKMVELLGVSKEEILDKKWGDSVVSSDKQRAMKVFKQVLENGYYNENTQFRTKDGRNINVEIHGSIVEIDGSKYIQSHVIDVTEQVRLEERYSGFMQLATDSFSIYDENLDIVDVNEKWILETGLTREEVIGKNILEIFPYLEETGRYSAYQEVLKTGEPVEFKATINTNLNNRYFDIKAFKVYDNLGLISSEVTDKMRYQRRLEALHSHGILLSGAETMDDVAEITQQTLQDIIDFNVGGLGIVEDDVLVQKYLWGLDGPEKVSLPLDGEGVAVFVINSGKTRNIRDVTKVSDYLTAHYNKGMLSELCVPILESGKSIGVINVESKKLDAFTVDDQKLVETLAQHVASVYIRLRNIKTQSELEREILVREVLLDQELELSQLKTRFMSTATHELRTPLTSIMGYTELITYDEGNLSPDQRRYFDVILKNVERLNTLTNDIMDVQRLEEGKLSLNLEQVALNDLIQDVITEINPLIMERKQTVTSNCVDVQIPADRLRIMQVVVNLLSNASKFSEESGQIHVDVSLDSSGAKISVTDSGIGINEEDMGRLFNPFPGILVDGNVRGTGLGLSICKGIVDLHGGTIWAESSGLGKGTKFSFILPY